MIDPHAALTALICEHSGLTGVRAERLAERIAAEWLPVQVDAQAGAHAVAWQDRQNIICACGEVFSHDYGKSPAPLLGSTDDYYLREHCGDRYARHLRKVRAVVAGGEHD